MFDAESKPTCVPLPCTGSLDLGDGALTLFDFAHVPSRVTVTGGSSESLFQCRAIGL